MLDVLWTNANSLAKYKVAIKKKKKLNEETGGQKYFFLAVGYV